MRSMVRGAAVAWIATRDTSRAVVYRMIGSATGFFRANDDTKLRAGITVARGSHDEGPRAPPAAAARCLQRRLDPTSRHAARVRVSAGHAHRAGRQLSRHARRRSVSLARAGRRYADAPVDHRGERARAAVSGRHSRARDDQEAADAVVESRALQP